VVREGRKQDPTAFVLITPVIYAARPGGGTARQTVPQGTPNSPQEARDGPRERGHA